MTETADIIARFHRVLVEEIREHRPEYLHGPFTVAEIYQNLAPYSTHRDRIGVEMNGDYEDALIRLLSGEGGYLVLDSGPALRALKDELESTNPNTGMYRDYAAVDVRLNPSLLDLEARWQAGLDSVRDGSVELHVAEDDPVSVEDLAPGADEPTEAWADGDSSSDAEHVEADPTEADPVTRGEDGGGEDDTCRWCRAGLPHRSNLNYCPFCGQNVNLVPCPDCGEELEPDWRFCISCGTEVGA